MTAINSLAIERQIKDLKRRAADDGVHFELKHYQFNGFLYFWRFSRMPWAKKGEGARWLNKVCEFADEHELVIRLDVCELDRYLSDAYYPKFGFTVVDEDQNRGYEFCCLGMERQPQYPSFFEYAEYGGEG